MTSSFVQIESHEKADRVTGKRNNIARQNKTTGMAKKIMLDLVPFWRDRGINKELQMELV